MQARRTQNPRSRSPRREQSSTAINRAVLPGALRAKDRANEAKRGILPEQHQRASNVCRMVFCTASREAEFVRKTGRPRTWTHTHYNNTHIHTHTQAPVANVHQEETRRQDIPSPSPSTCTTAFFLFSFFFPPLPASISQRLLNLAAGSHLPPVSMPRAWPISHAGIAPIFYLQRVECTLCRVHARPRKSPHLATNPLPPLQAEVLDALLH